MSVGAPVFVLVEPVVESGHKKRGGGRKKKKNWDQLGRPNPGYLRTEENRRTLAI